MSGVAAGQSDGADGAGRLIHERIAAVARLQFADRVAQTQPQIRDNRTSHRRAGIQNILFLHVSVSAISVNTESRHYPSSQ